MQLIAASILAAVALSAHATHFRTSELSAVQFGFIALDKDLNMHMLVKTGSALSGPACDKIKCIESLGLPGRLRGDYGGRPLLPVLREPRYQDRAEDHWSYWLVGWQGKCSLP
ncbi:unnamed protein product [Polarella glacialis]|uniref:Subtilisin n=1 Tax=Polarella glacialis TaxID=89957 RepID=A0A813E3Q7_POLGL|nr:unnamed protein product [Polarella glacialis]CAE8685647.1 unnamed protein product [Polarella glacialis]